VHLVLLHIRDLDDVADGVVDVGQILQCVAATGFLGPLCDHCRQAEGQWIVRIVRYGRTVGGGVGAVLDGGALVIFVVVDAVYERDRVGHARGLHVDRGQVAAGVVAVGDDVRVGWAVEVARGQRLRRGAIERVVFSACDQLGKLGMPGGGMI